MKTMNLLLAEAMFDRNHLELLPSIIDCLENRLEWLEDREPESEGEVYDSWEEKYSAFEDILNEYTECQEIIEDNIVVIDDKNASAENLKIAEREIYDAIISVTGLLSNFQHEYHGISKLNITI